MIKNTYLLLLILSITTPASTLASSVIDSGIAVVVHRENPIASLSSYEVKKIFLGRLREFPRTNNPIEVLDQNSESDTYKTFYNQLIGFKLNKLRRYRAAYLFSGKGVLPTELKSNESVINQLQVNINAIGYIEQALVDDNMKVIYSWTP